MSANNINHTTANNLCISCGLCKGVCPGNYIELMPSEGMFIPRINETDCIGCGMCYKVCPGKGFDYDAHPLKDSAGSFWFGDYKELYTAHTDNPLRRKNSVSGGMASELVNHLLTCGYSSAFLVSGHSYGKEQIKAERFTKTDSSDACAKSRYLCVSQENTVKYILSHREEKIVLVGVGCFVEGIINVIDAYGLNRDNYFIIGLFCDKTMSQNVIDYFRRKKYTKGSTPESFFFRTKEAGGWPGGVRIVTKDGISHDYKNTERMQVKEYFQPERCLYCLDKLNRYADISLGDNYTGNNHDPLGSNTVIIRTEKGADIMKELAALITSEPTDEQTIIKSQKLGQRKQNLAFSAIKEKKVGSKINFTGSVKVKVTMGDRLKYGIRMGKIAVGSRFEKNPGLLCFCLIEQKAKTLIKRILKGA